MLFKVFGGAFLISFLNCIVINAQLKINFPQERAIFQRDNDNNGFIPIHGYVPPNTSRVEARLLPVSTGQGTLTDWQIIDSSPSYGTFAGKVLGKGGWYVLQVRSFDGELQNGTTQVGRIGIGEIFIIAGQSNGQGFLRFNPRGATDDRVNAYGTYTEAFSAENPDIVDFKQLTRTQNIGPHGQSAWAWGELGDKLAARLNVPILFFNVAYEGTSVENWVKSAKGEPTVHPGFGFTFPADTPYSFLRIILQNHVNLYGLRSVIWIQGESDSNTSESEYFNGLKFVIEQSRKDAAKDIEWMVTRTSLLQNQTFQQIIDAQNRIILEVPKVQPGPETDIIQNPRVDGVHLSNVDFGFQGISELAASFDRNMGSFYFGATKPVQGYSFKKPTTLCTDNNEVLLTFAGNYQSIKWNESVSSNSIQAVSGEYQALVRDFNNNYIYSALVDIPRVYPQQVPRVSAEGPGTACVGGNLIYKVDRSDLGVIWHDGSTNQTYSSTKNENITAFYKNNIGCISNSSNSVRSNFVPKPAPPVIISKSGRIGACEGESISLGLQDPRDYNITWNTFETTSDITISATGQTEVTAVVSTSLGCSSEISSPFVVSIEPTPVAPSIFQSGPYSLAVSLEANEGEVEWFNEDSFVQTGSQIAVSQDGFYKVRAIKTFDNLGISCQSGFSGLYAFKRNSDVTGVKVYPNPIVGDEFFLTSDRKITNVLLTMIDAVGRVRFRTSVTNLDVPQTIRLKGEQYFGQNYLRLDYDGFFKVIPLVFE